MRGAGVAQRHRGAGQQHRVLSHAPAPDHGGDPERGDDPDATQPVGGEQGQDGQAAQPGVDHQDYGRGPARRRGSGSSR
jgi:hypothetical protein